MDKSRHTAGVDASYEPRSLALIEKYKFDGLLLAVTATGKATTMSIAASGTRLQWANALADWATTGKIFHDMQPG